MLYGAIAVNKQDTGFAFRSSHLNLWFRLFSDYTHVNCCLWPNHRSTSTFISRPQKSRHSAYRLIVTSVSG
jgi:hypothetical protein